MAWYNESARHSKAARGIRTGRKCPAACMSFTEHKKRSLATASIRKVPVQKKTGMPSRGLSIEPLTGKMHGIYSEGAGLGLGRTHASASGISGLTPVHSESVGITEGHGGIQTKSLLGGMKDMFSGLGLGLEQRFIKVKHILEPRVKTTELEGAKGQKLRFHEGGTEATKKKRYEALETRAILAKEGIKMVKPDEPVDSDINVEEEEELDKEVEKVYEQEGIRKLSPAPRRKGSIITPNGRIRRINAKRREM